MKTPRSRSPPVTPSSPTAPSRPTASSPPPPSSAGRWLVELLFPYIAQSPESTATLYIQTQSGRDMAGGASTPDDSAAFDITVPGTIRLTTRPGTPGGGTTLAPGYADLTIDRDPYAVDPLEDGRFAFSIPYEMGDTPPTSYAVPRPEGRRRHRRTPDSENPRRRHRLHRLPVPRRSGQRPVDHPLHRPHQRRLFRRDGSKV